MKLGVLACLALYGGAGWCVAVEFEAPVRLKAGGVPIRVESPGYAAPAWVDLNGKRTLLVGQFNGGKIQTFQHQGGLQFAAGTWLQAGGKAAEIPGVW
jgi:hypothetical protein